MSKRYLIFDTETTGVAKDFKAPPSTGDNWPRIVQLAWSIQEDGRELSRSNFIIYPDGFIIPDEAAKIHGITTERALKEGLPIKDVMRHFHSALKLVDAVVCHNSHFDTNVAASEFLRINGANYMDGIEVIDTMRPLSEYCGIPNKWGGYKWPTLQELHTKLFGCGFDDAHDANVDISVTIRCFWECKKLALITD